MSAIAVGLMLPAFGMVRPALALRVDPAVSFTQPSNALLMPFDAMGSNASLLIASNVAGTAKTPITTHWAFWDADGTGLGEAFFCLGVKESMEVDPRRLRLQDPHREGRGPTTDLSGHRGMVTVTAYETDDSCLPAQDNPTLVDDAIVGSYSIRESTLLYGSNAIGLGLDPTGRRTALPRATLEANWETTRGLAIPTRNPDSLRRSRLVLLFVVEGQGGTFGDKEIGPVPPSMDRAEAWPVLRDAQGIATSLPNVTIGPMLFTSLKPGAAGGLIPRTVSISSSGFLEFPGLKETLIGAPIAGWNGFVFAIHGQQVKKTALTSNGIYGIE